jgi:hypothetical protein
MITIKSIGGRIKLSQFLNNFPKIKNMDEEKLIHSLFLSETQEEVARELEGETDEEIEKEREKDNKK